MDSAAGRTARSLHRSGNAVRTSGRAAPAAAGRKRCSAAPSGCVLIFGACIPGSMRAPKRRCARSRRRGATSRAAPQRSQIAGSPRGLPPPPPPRKCRARSPSPPPQPPLRRSPPPRILRTCAPLARPPRPARTRKPQRARATDWSAPPTPGRLAHGPGRAGRRRGASAAAARARTRRVRAPRGVGWRLRGSGCARAPPRLHTRGVARARGVTARGARLPGCQGAQAWLQRR